MFREAAAAQSAVGWRLKRLLDIVLATLALAALSPLMLAVVLAIKLDSPGPAFIRQERVGHRLLPFEMFKFRSMVQNAADLLGDLQAMNEATPPLFKIRSDPRLTRVGKYLRRFSIDEVPQLINVLRGEMSLVGPRPPFAHEVEFDYIRQELRLRQIPGMTGLWQVSGRSGLGYEDMIALDLRYQQEWSFVTDVAILLRTPAAVLTGRGAH